MKYRLRLPLMFTFVYGLFVACNNPSNSITTNDDTNVKVQDTISGSTNNDSDTINSTVPNDAWDSTQGVQIVLNGTKVTINGNGATASGSLVTITSAGTYNINGYLADGQVVVNTKDKDDVRIVLNDAEINSSSSAAIYIADAEGATIVLADNSHNLINNGPKSLGIPLAMLVPLESDDEPNAAIYSKTDLVLTGNGSLTVNAMYNDGITSKDGLVIESGVISVTAKDDGIRGKDYLKVNNGTITINSQGDGLISDNSTDSTKGYIEIGNGTFNITSQHDAIAAETRVTLNGGTYNITSGGGSSKSVVDSISAKGIKANAQVTIADGNYIINSSDDAIQSNRNMTINGGSITISTADDAIHADSSLTINGGDFNITKSFEGIESYLITINNGKFQIISTEDAITAETNLKIVDGEFTVTSGGGSSKTIADSSSAKALKGIKNILIEKGIYTISSADDAIHSDFYATIKNGTFSITTSDDAIHADSIVTIEDGIFNIPKCYEGIEGSTVTINGGEIHIVASDDGINAAGDGEGRPGVLAGPPGPGPQTAGTHFFYLNDGYIFINASGDGMDINGSVEMAAGTLVIDGPTSDMEAPIDYDRGFKLTSGFVVATGSAGMALVPDNTSSQNSVLITFRNGIQANTIFHIQSSDGDNILTIMPSKRYASVAFSSPELKQASTYTVFSGGGCTGTKIDGLYQGGVYTPGTQKASFTVNSVVTKVNF